MADAIERRAEASDEGSSRGHCKITTYAAEPIAGIV